MFGLPALSSACKTLASQEKRSLGETPTAARQERSPRHLGGGFETRLDIGTCQRLQIFALKRAP